MLNSIEKSPKNRMEIIAFSASVFVLSSLICFISYKRADANLSILPVFTPSLVALVLTAAMQGKRGLYELFVSQTVRKTAFKWLVFSLFGIPVLASLAVLTSLSFDVTRFALRTTQLLPQIVIIVLIAIGEEYGWRGFLLPRLIDRFGLLKSSLILGLIWGFWHLPAYLIGTGVPQEMSFLVFLLWVVLGTLFINWIYCYTRSVLTSILAHVGANAAFNYLPVLPEFTGSMDLFWIFIGYLSVLVAALYFWRRQTCEVRFADDL